MKKKSFIGYISADWKIEKYTHFHLVGFHECIGVDSNISTKKGMKNCSSDRVKIKVTIEEI